MELNQRRLREVVALAGLLLLGYWGLQNLDTLANWLNWGINLCMPFVIGGAIAFIMHVPMHAIEIRLPTRLAKGQRGIAFTLTLLGLLAVLGIVSGLVAPQLVTTVMRLTAALPGFGNSILTFLYEVSAAFPFLEPMIAEWASLNWQTLAESTFTFITQYGSSLMGDTVSAASGIFGGIISAVVSFIFCLYLLFEQETLSRQGRMILYALLPEARAARTLEIANRSKRIFASFLTGQCLEAVILGLIFAVAMALLNMPYIPLICVLISVTALIPMVGAFLGCAIGALLIAVDDPLQALGFCVLFIVLQQLENNLIYPRVVGSSIGLPSMWVLVAITVGGGIGGAAGMILMIPLTSVLYSILCETVYKRLATRGLLDGFLPKAEDVPTNDAPAKDNASKQKTPAATPENTDA